jgi:hypothetical protein
MPLSQFVQPSQDDEEEEPWAVVQDPQDLYWCLMTKGERSCRLKACCSTLHLLCLHKSSGTGFQISVAPVLVCFSIPSVRQTRWHRVSRTGGTGFGVFQYPFCQANSVAPSFQNRWHRFLAVGCNRPM